MPSSPERGTAAPRLRPMSIVDKRSPISATVEHLFFYICDSDNNAAAADVGRRESVTWHRVAEHKQVASTLLLRWELRGPSFDQSGSRQQLVYLRARTTLFHKDYNYNDGNNTVDHHVDCDYHHSEDAGANRWVAWSVWSVLCQRSWYGVRDDANQSEQRTLISDDRTITLSK